MKHPITVKVLFSIMLIGFSVNFAFADSISKPHAFTAGEPAKAAEVNANFDTVYDQVNKLGSLVNVDSANQRVGIGTASPGEKLTVNGTVESKSGGFKFPDGTVQTTASASSSGIPSGGILMWSGSVSNIPGGWALCNGANGTPDLRDRFIVGAGNTYSPGVTGGVSSHNLAHSHIVNSHSHHIDEEFRSCIHDCEDGCEDGDKAVGSDDHGHHLITDSSLESPGTNSQLSGTDNRPPYYALCFIMKLN